nr:ESX secretion-associated protein EspG [Labedaea rhizosphaerae]
MDFLWESQGGGELPYPLEVASHGATMDERSRLRNETFAILRDSGLLDREGGLDRRLAGWFALLARAERSIDSVFVPGDGEPMRAMVALASGDRALLAEQRPDGVLVQDLHPSSLASTVVDALPPGTRGTERSFTVLAADEPTVPLLSEPRLRGGQFGVNHRDAVDGRRRARVLAWFDLRSGRYLMYRKPGPDGREWLTVAPSDALALRQRLTELLTR